MKNAIRGGIAAACLFLLTSMSLLADPPKVEKEAVAAKVGEVVTFTVQVEKGKELGFQPGFKPADCTLVRLFSDDPAVYSFLAQPKKAGQFVAVFWTAGEKKGTTVTIGSAAPAPPKPKPDTPDNPNPPKPDTPAPVLPDGKFKLAKTVYDLAVKTVPAGANRGKAATALADSFDGIAASIAAGVLSKDEDILAQTTASNRAKLDDLKVSRTAWEPAFKGLMDAVYKLYQDGKLPTKNDYRDAWKEISEGLRAVK